MMKKKPEIKKHKVQCEIVALYRYEIRYENENNDYEFVIVADTIAGLIGGIVKRELIHSMKECRKYLDTKEFLIMPCEQAVKGYHLFDIDEHDCGGMVNDFDEEMYETHFKGKIPVSIGHEKEASEIYSALFTLMKGLHKKTDEPEGWEHFAEYELYALLGHALYESERVQEAVKKAKEKQAQHDMVELESTIIAINKLMKLTG
jgi:hypothetical protein